MLRAFRAELRVNTDPKRLFWKKKGESVAADYAADVTEAGSGTKIAITGIRDAAASGTLYIRLAFAAGEGAGKTYFRGNLFDNDRKVDGRNHPDYTGDLLVDQETGDKLRLAAWIKFEDPNDESTAFLSLDVSEFRRAGEATDSKA
ncbi:hypothetical protein ACN8ZM_39785 (plasmid) [Burkholderia aenigmatica]|uniref:hypothetical protein n=1 Tax=Burkholderia aenigmatica TaxID=2015348 RepID=UPI003B43847F